VYLVLLVKPFFYWGLFRILRELRFLSLGRLSCFLMLVVAWLRITPVFRKRYEISFRFRQRRARNYAEITRNRALFSEITKDTANYDDTIYRNTQPRVVADS
jgi:hypothetical protein